MKSILVLCTGNSCRSQMAECFLKSFDQNLDVYSAGTVPSDRVHPKAIQVMHEVGIDISKNNPKNVSLFLNSTFDFLITVCEEAKESCPTFYGKVKKRLHMDFEDPAKATGSEEEILKTFRRIRDEIKREFREFYKKEVNIK